MSTVHSTLHNFTDLYDWIASSILNWRQPLSIALCMHASYPFTLLQHWHPFHCPVVQWHRSLTSSWITPGTCVWYWPQLLAVEFIPITTCIFTECSLFLPLLWLEPIFRWPSPKHWSFLLSKDGIVYWLPSGDLLQCRWVVGIRSWWECVRD